MSKAISYLIAFCFFLVISLNCLANDVKVSVRVPSTITADSEFTVEVIFEKGDISGIGRFHQKLPEGFSAEAIDEQGATFTVENNRLKLIWMQLPEEDRFSVTYKMYVGPSVSGDYTLTGEFNYVKDDERHIIHFNKNIYVEPAELSQNIEEEVAEEESEEKVVEEESEPELVEEEPEEEIVEEEQEVEVVEEEQEVEVVEEEQEVEVVEEEPEAEVVEEEPEAEVVEEEPEAEVVEEEPEVEPEIEVEEKDKDPTRRPSGIQFSVQIKASTNVIHPSEIERIKNEFDLKEQVYHEKINGWNKYSVGSFNTYQDASDYKAELRSKGLEGAFVIAFKDGERVSMDEALGR